jgi:hypothetical protein
MANATKAGDSFDPRTAPMAKSLTSLPHVMKPGDSFGPGAILMSKNKQFLLIYQGDGNLVIYDVSLTPPLAIWNTITMGHTPGSVQMQHDGNFVVYDSANHSQFDTGTFLKTRKGLSIRLQDDGNLVLHGIAPLYTSFSSPGVIGPPAPPPVQQGGGTDLISVLETAEDVIDIVASFL